jgi:hypothetical protein
MSGFGNDTINGAAYSDLLSSGSGTDYLPVGPIPTFTFMACYQLDTLVDFVAVTHKISSEVFRAWMICRCSSRNDNGWIEHRESDFGNGDELTVSKVASTSFTAADFSFA